MVSVADREWLRLNWTPREPSFRHWVAGSKRAHDIVLGLLEEGPDAEVERLRKALRLVQHWHRHPLGRGHTKMILAVDAALERPKGVQ